MIAVTDSASLKKIKFPSTSINAIWLWGLIDRTSYADFGSGILENKGVFYFVLMGVLVFLCICGIVMFGKNIKNNYWWRWIYILGEGYL